VNKEQERIGQRLLTSQTFQIMIAPSLDSVKRISSLMRQLFFRYFSHQLDSNFLLIVVHLRFTFSGF